MHNAGERRFLFITTHENKTKHLLDNYYGTGQSVIDGILRSTCIFLASKNVVVVGFGPCGKGVALRAKGMGANVIVTEVDPFCALQAVYDGYQVMTMAEAAPLGGERAKRAILVSRRVRCEPRAKRALARQQHNTLVVTS